MTRSPNVRTGQPQASASTTQCTCAPTAESLVNSASPSSRYVKQPKLFRHCPQLFTAFYTVAARCCGMQRSPYYGSNLSMITPLGEVCFWPCVHSLSLRSLFLLCSEHARPGLACVSTVSAGSFECTCGSHGEPLSVVQIKLTLLWDRAPETCHLIAELAEHPQANPECSFYRNEAVPEVRQCCSRYCNVLACNRCTHSIFCLCVFFP
jgi:hypothetical protein